MPDLRRGRTRLTVKLHVARERIAGIHVAAVEAAPEPAHALRRRAVIEAFRHDIALAAFLQRVVADLLGGVQRFLQVALAEEALLVRMLAPDAGKAVRLASASLIRWRASLNLGRMPVRFCT
jgi:hypothetical protein